MDARRLELYELLKPKLDEEPARALVLALPADPDRLSTKDDLDGLGTRLTDHMDARFASVDARFTSVDARFTSVDAHFTTVDAHFTTVDTRFESLEAKMDARFSQMEATLTRRMVTIMGAWTILLGSTVGWVSVLLR